MTIQILCDKCYDRSIPNAECINLTKCDRAKCMGKDCGMILIGGGTVFKITTPNKSHKPHKPYNPKSQVMVVSKPRVHNPNPQVVMVHKPRVHNPNPQVVIVQKPRVHKPLVHHQQQIMFVVEDMVPHPRNPNVLPLPFGIVPGFPGAHVHYGMHM